MCFMLSNVFECIFFDTCICLFYFRNRLFLTQKNKIKIKKKCIFSIYNDDTIVMVAK